MLQGNNWDDFANGYRALIDGRMPERINECVVSTEFAELNGISVNDPIQLFGMLLEQDRGRVNPIEYNLTVTGIYFSAEEVSGGSISWGGTLTNRLNEILTVFETIDNNLAGVTMNARYYLKNPAYLEDFDREVREKGLHSMFDVSTDIDTYNAIVGPVEGMRGITTTFMIIVLILGAIILILLSSIAIRERKYEIGVLRAMGMKKAKVALGLWFEMIIITMFCLIIGIGTGSLVAQPISDTLLTQQIENAQKLQELSGGGFFTMNIGDNSRTVDDDPIAEVNMSLGIDTMLQLMLISLLLASVAGFAAISRITKYEPIKILMERN
jgi:putative ABC transport system permease protein